MAAKIKNRRRTVWMSDPLWEKIEQAGRRDNRTASSWLRDRAEAALEAEKQARGRGA